MSSKIIRPIPVTSAAGADLSRRQNSSRCGPAFRFAAFASAQPLWSRRSARRDSSQREEFYHLRFAPRRKLARLSQFCNSYEDDHFVPDDGGGFDGLRANKFSVEVQEDAVARSV